MNSKKKADLQRKLTMPPVPRPPSNLAERIKRDIPQHFTMSSESERDRISRSLGLNMRVAASVLLVVSSAYLFMQLYAHSQRNASTLMTEAAAPKPVAAARKTDTLAQKKEAAEPLAASSYGYLSPSAQAAPAAPSIPRPMQVADGRLARQMSPVAVAGQERRRDAENDEQVGQKDHVITAYADTRAVEGGVEGGVVGGVVGGTAGGVVGTAPVAEPMSVADNAAAAPPPPPPAPPALAREEAAPQRSADAESITITASAPTIAAPASKFGEFPSLVKTAQASELKLGARNEVFGISVDRGAFERVKSAIERGERPDAVNVEALVNYFAGPAPHTRKEVQLDTEGSPAPVAAGERRGILRYTVDTATAEVPPGASVPPVAVDAKVEISFEPAAVASHHRIGAPQEEETIEATLLKNVSVTALYEIEMKPTVTARQRVATVRLTYTSVADGRKHDITRPIYGRDFAHPWRTASRRHRLASLGAVWGETLKGAASGTDVARRAEELAIQEPKDAKARELAELATASSRLRSSSPTGSGR